MKTHVFTSGQDGYHTYRIPALLMTKAGTLLAFCEGRRTGRGDHGDLDLLVKRSEDSGETWSEQLLIYGEPGEVTIGNPCPVVDDDTGVIWLPFCRENDDVFMTHSADDGETWADPVDITADVKMPTWGWYATGPGVGIQLQRGEHRGRLVIPCDHREDGNYGNGSHTIYSDDHGATWQLSALITPGANECQVVELSDGSLKMNIRMQTYSEGLRGISVSGDGGHNWSEVVHDANLPCPKCQASLIGEGDRLIFSNPVSPTPVESSEAGERFYPGKGRGERVNMTVRLSEDGGQTWPREKLLHEGPAAYSCLTLLPDGDIGCLYEAGEEHSYQYLVFERFSL